MTKRTNRSQSNMSENNDPQNEEQAKATEEQTVPVKLKSDVWYNGFRHTEGDTAHFSVEKALRLIENGKAERADPMPNGRKE